MAADNVLKPVVARYQGKVSRIYLRADAAFAMPEVYEFLEAERDQRRIGRRDLPDRTTRAGKLTPKWRWSTGKRCRILKGLGSPVPLVSGRGDYVELDAPRERSQSSVIASVGEGGEAIVGT